MAEDTKIVTNSELEEAKKIYFKSIFDKNDVDGDGKMDVAELEKLLRADQDVSHKVVKKLVKYSDKNNDGKIDFPEFLDMVHDKNFRQLFGRYVDSYVNVIVPRYKPVGRRGGISEPEGETDLEEEHSKNVSCWPPPVGMITMSLIEIACFVTDEVTQHESMKNGNGVTANLFIYSPYKRIQCWRFLTYMFVHVGYFHLMVNLLTQVLLGTALELANQNQWWRVIIIYFAGVVAGSLLTSITDPTAYLAGASGGVYAIITAHLSNLLMNWNEKNHPSVQLILFILLITADVGTAIYNRYYLGLNQNIGYAAHFGGALAGLLVGIWIVNNVKVTTIEKYLWWTAFMLYILLMGTAVMLNIFWTDHFLNRP